MPDPSIVRLMKMNASEWYFIVIGCIMALAQGVIQPAFALIFGSILGVSCFCYCSRLVRIKHLLGLHEICYILLRLNILIFVRFRSGRIWNSRQLLPLQMSSVNNCRILIAR